MKNDKLRKIIFASVFIAIIAACSWISIPMPLTSIPITLQTFAIFFCILVLGGKYATISVVGYITLGIIGIPVFTYFRGGIGVILGATGGYIVGFVFICLIYWATEFVFKNTKIFVKILALIVGTIVCYIFGTLWFVFVYMKNSGEMSFISALSLCVFPYIIPDMIKLGLAIGLYLPLKKVIEKYI